MYPDSTQHRSATLCQHVSSTLTLALSLTHSLTLHVFSKQMDVGKPLDVDSELATVGWSNVVSGLCGGFTGSYIFSQTIFTCRSGCHSKGVGMAPISVYYPLPLPQL
jgi:sulfate permease, SulP family